MDTPPRLHERVAVVVGSGLFALPLSFMFWLSVNLWFWGTDDLGLAWFFGGVALFACLGFLFPRHVGQVFGKAWQFLIDWF